MTLLEGKTPETARPGPEIFVRCKIAARGTSDCDPWRPRPDCAGRMGLGFRPGPETHVLDTLGGSNPECEDLSRTRKDRAYAFEARLSSLDDTSREPGGEDPQFLRFDGEESLELGFGDGVLVPQWSALLADRGPRRIRPSCIGGSALQGTPVQTLPSLPSCPTSLRDQWWEASGAMPPCTLEGSRLKRWGMDPEKVPFKICLLQKPGESWTIWDTRDLRSHQSAVRRMRFQLRSALRSSGQDAGRNGQAGRLRDLRGEVGRGR